MSALTDDVLKELARPFAPNAIRFKLQATWPKEKPHTGLVVSYIDARTVAARLDHVVGADWSTRPEPWGQPNDANLAICHLTVRGVTRSDVGKGGGFEKEKAALSDSFKRAAVLFGVGRYLYFLSSVKLKKTKQGDTPALAEETAGNKKTLALTPECTDWLRGQYAGWLKTKRNVWGDPLDHHHEEGAIGDEAEPVLAAEQPDPDFEAERQGVLDLYKQTTKGKPALRKKLPEARVKAQLEGAESAEDLKSTREKVESLS